MVDTRLDDAAAEAGRKDWARAADILSSGPQTDDIMDKRGWYLSRAKRYDEAIAVFTELRGRRMHDYRPPYMIGYQHYQQEEWRACLPWFEEALGHKPDHLKSMWRKAHALEQLGEQKRAMLLAGRILRLWHELPAERQEEDRKLVGRASYLLGRHQLTRDPAGAVELFAQAAEFQPGDPYTHYKHAKALRLSGRGADALGPAERAYGLKPGDPNITAEYADALWSCGRSAEARKLLSKVARRCTGWTAFRAGVLALKTDDPRLSVYLLRQASRDHAVRADPRVKEALDEAISRAGGTAQSERGSTDNRRTPRRQLAVPDSNHQRPRGRVDVVRADRGFGFLVDGSGVRRHFKLRSHASLRLGQEVTFTPVDAAKGPAANDVSPL